MTLHPARSRTCPARDDQPATVSLHQKVLVALGVLVLAYIYSDSLSAQSASAPRVSISQAVNFPSDI